MDPEGNVHNSCKSRAVYSQIASKHNTLWLTLQRRIVKRVLQEVIR